MSATPAALPLTRSTFRGRLRALRLASRGVTLGRDVILARDVQVEVAPGASLTIGRGAIIGGGTRILVRAGAVEIGEGSVLGERCVLVAHAGITLGRHCLVGDRVAFVDAEPVHDDVERPTREQGLSATAIAVGDGARIGHGAALADGARIPTGGSVEPHVVVGGGPDRRRAAGGAASRKLRTRG